MIKLDSVSRIWAMPNPVRSDDFLILSTLLKVESWVIDMYFLNKVYYSALTDCFNHGNHLHVGGRFTDQGAVRFVLLPNKVSQRNFK